MRRDTPYLSVFSPNAEKYGSEKTPCLDTCHAVNNLLSNLTPRSHGRAHQWDSKWDPSNLELTSYLTATPPSLRGIIFLEWISHFMACNKPSKFIQLTDSTKLLDDQQQKVSFTFTPRMLFHFSITYRWSVPVGFIQELYLVAELCWLF